MRAWAAGRGGSSFGGPIRAGTYTLLLDAFDRLGNRSRSAAGHSAPLRASRAGSRQTPGVASKQWHGRAYPAKVEEMAAWGLPDPLMRLILAGALVGVLATFGMSGQTRGRAANPLLAPAVAASRRPGPRAGPAASPPMACSFASGPARTRDSERLSAGVRASHLDARCISVVSSSMIQRPGVSGAEAVRRLERSRHVRYAEPNLARRLAAVPADPDFDQLWGLHNTGQTVNGLSGTPDADIDAPEAWDLTTGSPSRWSRSWTAASTTPPGSGGEHLEQSREAGRRKRVERGRRRPRRPGGRLARMGLDRLRQRSPGRERTWHTRGGHDCGQGPERHGGGRRVLARSPASPAGDGRRGNGWTSELVDAYSYAAAHAARESRTCRWARRASRAQSATRLPPRPTRCSWSRPATRPTTTTGRVSIPAATSSPTSCAWPRATRRTRARSFSNHGSKSVDLAAPGVDILSTWPGGGWATRSGASMATAHVTGVVSLMLARRPHLSTVALKQALLGAVDPKPQLANITSTGGRLNAYRAIVAPAGRWM